MSGTVAPATSRTYLLAIVGAVALVIVAAVTFQWLRPSAASADATGRAAVSKADAGAESAAKKTPLARVDGVMIYYDEVARASVDEYGAEILENLISRKIIQNACQKHGIEIGEEEIDAEVQKIAKRFNLTVEQWLGMLQAERKVTPSRYKKDIIWPMLALRKLAGGEVKITREELDKEFLRNYGPRVKAKVIVLDNQRRGAEVWEEVHAHPETFEQAVYKHSVDPASRPLGGSVPPISRYSSSEAVEKAAFALKPGEVSGLIMVDSNQYVILKCEGHTEQVVTDIKEVESTLKESLHEKKTQEAVAKVFDRIKAEARVDNYLLGVSSKKSQNRSGGQVDPAGATETRNPARVTPAGNAPTKTSARPASTKTR